MAQVEPEEPFGPGNQRASREEAAIRRAVIEFGKAAVASTDQPKFWQRVAGVFSIVFSRGDANGPVSLPVVHARLPPACHKGARSGQLDFILQNRPVIVWNPQNCICSCNKKLSAKGEGSLA